MEQILNDHRAALAAAKGVAGSSITSVLDALDADVLLSKGPHGADKRSVESASSEPPEFGTPPVEATMKALRAHNFKAWCAAFSSLSLSTREGRLGALPNHSKARALVNIVGYLGTTKSNLPTNPGPRHLVAAIPDEHDMDIVAN